MHEGKFQPTNIRVPLSDEQFAQASLALVQRGRQALATSRAPAHAPMPVIKNPVSLEAVVLAPPNRHGLGLTVSA